jgi:hypothetical protein
MQMPENPAPMIATLVCSGSAKLQQCNREPSASRSAVACVYAL